jgi:AraC-like DNA-binding protein
MLGRSGHTPGIYTALRQIHANYADPVSVADLAGAAGMSLSAFHQHFKAVTSSPPLQYVKAVRLHKARLLIVHDRLGAAAAAYRVGYESASQFSREFKRFFGRTPLEESRRGIGQLSH